MKCIVALADRAAGRRRFMLYSTHCIRHADSNSWPDADRGSRLVFIVRDMPKSIH